MYQGFRYGINLFDSQLTNIVIMAWDRITFLQMLGRKRIDIDNPDQVNLYIPLRYKNSFRSKARKNNKKLDEIKLYKNNKKAFYRKYDYNLKTFKDINDIFFRFNKTGEFRLNPIGHTRLQMDNKFFTYMINKFDEIGEFAFTQEQLKWLDLEDKFSEDNLIGEVILADEVNELEHYIESIVGEKLFSEDQQKLSDLIINELITLKANIDYRTKKLKPSTLESIIRVQLGLPFAISKPKQETTGEHKWKRYIVISRIE